METKRPGHYLAQLCRHASLVARMSPQVRASVEWSDDHGVIVFSWGRCMLRASSGVLTLRAEAGDERSLRQRQQRVADRLEQIGRRGRLIVTWTAPSTTTS